MKRIFISIVSELESNMLNRWGLNPYNSVREAVEEEINKKEYGKAKIGIVKNGLDTLLTISEMEKHGMKGVSKKEEGD